MDPLAEYRDKWLPYRMQAIDLMGMYLGLIEKWETAPWMEVYVDQKLRIEGKASGFTNPAIEAGVLHSRALLDFLGLKLRRGTTDQLAERSRKAHANDIVIEDFGLERVTIAEATGLYPGDAAEAEAALATPILIANNWAAHNSAMLPLDPEQNHFLRIAAMGVPALMLAFFYERAGLKMPQYEIPSRPRTNGEDSGHGSDA